MFHIIEIKTSNRSEIIDITSDVENLITYDNFNGICIIYVPHTTCAVTINEGYDPDVSVDLLYRLSKFVPKTEKFRHIEGNSDAHIKSSLLGVNQTIIVENGKLVLGKWQRILFCEFDGPRNRKVYVKFIGDNR